MGFSIGKAISKIGGKGIGSAIGAVAGSFLGMPGEGAALGGSIGSMFGPSDERLERRQYNLEKKRALELWNMENAYNSPLQQMQRLAQAGLNPMLVYSSGNVTGNSSSGINLSSSKREVPARFDKSTFDFFMRNQMKSAENQNETQELINENWRLKNQKLARELENKGRTQLANAIRKDKPIKPEKLTQADRKIYHSILSDGKLDMNKEINRLNPGSYVFNWAVDHLGKHYADKIADIVDSYYDQIDKRQGTGRYWQPSMSYLK